MKSKMFFRVFYILALAVTVVNIVFSIKNSLFADINELPEGEWVQQIVSPSGKKIVNVYLVQNSMGSAIRADYAEGNDIPKNIFWQTNIDSVTVNWEREDVIFFDNIPISGDGAQPYDCRLGTSLFTDGAIADGFLPR